MRGAQEVPRGRSWRPRLPLQGLCAQVPSWLLSRCQESSRNHCLLVPTLCLWLMFLPNPCDQKNACFFFSLTKSVPLKRLSCGRWPRLPVNELLWPHVRSGGLFAQMGPRGQSLLRPWLFMSPRYGCPPHPGPHILGSRCGFAVVSVVRVWGCDVSDSPPFPAIPASTLCALCAHVLPVLARYGDSTGLCCVYSTEE